MKQSEPPRDSLLGPSFYENPIPMWVFDQKTLAFLEVNAAAVQLYGYTREQFLQMTILDIRPLEDVPRVLHELLDPGQRGASTSERWRHRRKNGEIFPVEISSWEITYNGCPAELVLAQASDSKGRRVESADHRRPQVWNVTSPAHAE